MKKIIWAAAIGIIGYFGYPKAMEAYNSYKTGEGVKENLSEVIKDTTISCKDLRFLKKVERIVLRSPGLDKGESGAQVIGIETKSYFLKNFKIKGILSGDSIVSAQVDGDILIETSVKEESVLEIDKGYFGLETQKVLDERDRLQRELQNRANNSNVSILSERKEDIRKALKNEQGLNITFK